MTVKELIVELLECDMDDTVYFDFITEGEDISESDFELELNLNYVAFIVESKDYVLIDKERFSKMEKRLNELESN